MGKLKTVDSYDMLTKTSKQRTINVDQIVEIEELISYDGQPLSRILLSSGGFVDVQKDIPQLQKEFEE